MNKQKVEFTIDLDDRDSIRDVCVELRAYLTLLSAKWRRMDITFPDEVENGKKRRTKT